MLKTAARANTRSRDGAERRGGDSGGTDDSGVFFERWQCQGDRRARDQLVERYLPLARKLALRYVGANEPFDDLLQVASLGLVKAVDRFDPDRGLAFSSFAVPTILGELRRYFRDYGWSVHVARGAQERALAVQHAARELTGESGGTPSVSELAQYLEWDSREVLDALEAGAAHHTTSLDAPNRDDDGSSLIDTLGAEDHSFELIDARLSVKHAMRLLPLNERRVVHMRFIDDLTQTQIGERLDISQMQVSRMLRSALTRLRELTQPEA